MSRKNRERLTERGHIYHSCEFMDDGMNVYMNKLREYEDKEEDTLLLHLPLAVGQHVTDESGEEYVVSWYVIYSSMTDAVQYQANHISDDILIRFKSSDIGRTIFIKIDPSCSNVDTSVLVEVEAK